MKKTIYVFIALLFALTMVTAGCGTPSGPAGQNLTVCVAADPATMDTGKCSSVDAAIMMGNCYSGLYGYADDSNGKLIVVPDCAQSIVEPTALDGGKFQYVVTLKQGLKWSDGQAMKASDFTYAWNRAVDPATASDYQYIFSVIDGYSDTTPKLNVKADDAAGTITIVTNGKFGYFNNLLAFPTYNPVRKDMVDKYGDKWATQVKSFITNGAFRMKDWKIGSKIVFEKNPNYWNAANVKLNTLTFALSDDDNAIYANYKNGNYQFTTTIPVTEIPTLKNDPTRMNKDFFIGDYIGTYYLVFNVNMSFKPGLSAPDKTADAWSGWTEAQNEDVRHALALLVDRNYIVNQVTQGGQIPATGFVPKGMDDGTGKEFRATAGDWWSADPAQQQANIDQALTILKKYYKFDAASGKFSDFPTFQYSINPSSGNKAIAEAILDQWGKYGINCSVDTRTWAVIQTALKAGDFTMSRMGWIADYNDPDDFLNMFLSASGNNYTQLGKDGQISKTASFGAKNDTAWSEYDAMYTKADSTPDASARAQILYNMENMLKTTYACAPLYFYTNPYLKSTQLQNMVYTPMGYVYFKTASFTTK